MEGVGREGDSRGKVESIGGGEGWRRWGGGG